MARGEEGRIEYLTGHLTGKKLAHVDRRLARLVIIERAAHGEKIVNSWTREEVLAMFERPE